MIDSKMILAWCEVEHDLYEENGFVFGIELDLFNGNKNYYCKTVEDGKEYYQYLHGDVFSAAEHFNAIVKEKDGEQL